MRRRRGGTGDLGARTSSGDGRQRHRGSRVGARVREQSRGTSPFASFPSPPDFRREHGRGPDPGRGVRQAFDGGWAVEETLKRDRDLVLAHSLQRPLAARADRRRDRRGARGRREATLGRRPDTCASLATRTTPRSREPQRRWRRRGEVRCGIRIGRTTPAGRLLVSSSDSRRAGVRGSATSVSPGAARSAASFASRAARGIGVRGGGDGGRGGNRAHRETRW